MRIIGGAYRSKKLYSPEYEGVRPTSDRAREAVFNILSSKLAGDWAACDMLDVFAGTGAVGLEALSRGVRSVTLLDVNLQTAHRNAALFAKEKDRISLISADASRLPPAPRQYNLVFLDAPYNKGLSVAALQSLAGQGWLADGALVLVELEKNEPLEMESIPFFEQVDERRYGLARVVFLHFLPAKK